LRSFQLANFRLLRIRCTTHVCNVVAGKTAARASPKLFRPSVTAIRMSMTPRDPLEASFEKFTFGKTGDKENLLGGTVAAEDYTNDGWDDLRCEFVFDDPLALGDTAAALKGKLGKITIIGTDSIDVRPQDEEEDEADEDD
jgi:hypothetical protein